MYHGDGTATVSLPYFVVPRPNRTEDCQVMPAQTGLTFFRQEEDRLLWGVRFQPV